MAVIAPHFDLPFRLGAAAAVVEQDTVDDVANCVYLLIRTHLGSRPEATAFGIRDLAFSTIPLDKNEIRDVISSSEPRAAAIIAERVDAFDSLIDHVVIEVTARGGV